jgi:uncharacterized PurR-regulated membrane protein YhhQ (DUF165 family)
VATHIALRREFVFLLLAGVFLGSLTMLNLIGITRFIKLGSWEGYTFAVAAGVLPYPLTFLCTDLISEFFGRRRATWVVWVGLLLNGLVVAVLWLATSLPGFAAIDPTTGMPPVPVYDAEAGVYVETGWTLFQLKNLAFGAVLASMIAYLAAQFTDVHLFHFWKRLTGGKHLWLRNNASTLASQLVDTTAVILITHFVARALPLDGDADLWPQLLTFILTGYVFKVVAALIDTPVIYAASAFLKDYLQIDPTHVAGHEQSSSEGVPSERL